MKHVLRTLFPILVGGAILAGCGHSVVPDHTADPAAAPAPVSSAPGGAWTVSPRTVPPPAQASAELRGSIAAAPVPDVAATAQFAPSTPEEWDAALAQFGGPQAEGVIDGLSAALSVTIEPGDIMGVKVYHVRPAEVSPDHADHLFVHVHGGAYVFGGGRGERVRSCGHRRRRRDSGGVHRLPHAAGAPVPGRRRRRRCRLGASADRATRVGDRPRWDVGRWGIGSGRHASVHRARSGRAGRDLRRYAVVGPHQDGRLAIHERGHRPGARRLRRPALGLRAPLRGGPRPEGPAPLAHSTATSTGSRRRISSPAPAISF